MKNLDFIPSCDICILKTNCIFKFLTKEELNYLIYQKETFFFKRNEIVYQEDTRINGFYCINKGIIKLYKTGVNGKEQIIRFVKAGDIMAYRSLLSEEKSCTSAKVIEDALICFIPSKILLEFIKNNGEFATQLMKKTCKELGEANSYIVDIAQKTIRERLAEVLLQLKKTFGLDKDNIIQINLTREELANLVGTATESVIRLLSEFKNEKWIETKGRKIKILNFSALLKLANEY